MPKKVSVVIPTHNRNVMLLEAINSVRGQTYKNYEILVVDDTHSESTKNIVKGITDLSISYLANIRGCGAGSSRNLLDSENDIREHLRNKLPDIHKKAFDAGFALEKILEEL